MRTRNDSGNTAVVILIGAFFIALIAAGGLYFMAKKESATRALEEAIVAREAATEKLAEFEREDAQRTGTVNANDGNEHADGHDHSDHEHDEDVDPEVAQLRAEKADLEAQLEALRDQIVETQAELLEDR